MNDQFGSGIRSDESNKHGYDQTAHISCYFLHIISGNVDIQYCYVMGQVDWSSLALEHEQALNESRVQSL